MPPRHLFIVDAFASKPFSGNPAGIVFLEYDEFPCDDILLKIAQEVNLAETAFFRQLQIPGTFHLRWFTPQGEINLCGHATLASAFVIFTCLELEEIKNLQQLFFETMSGSLIVTRIENGYFPITLEMDFPAWIPRKLLSSEVPRELLKGLGLSGNYVDIELEKDSQNDSLHLIKDIFDICPIYIGKSCRDYLIILPSPRDVMNLIPNYQMLEQVKDGVVIIVAAPGDGSIYTHKDGIKDVFSNERAPPDFVVRAFCPDCTSVPEDPVCGSAHCTLIPYFASTLKKKKMISHQISKRGGELLVELVEGGERVKIAGTATLFMKGVIDCF